MYKKYASGKHSYQIKVMLRRALETVCFHNISMMIIAPNSRAHEGKKERGDVKEEYGGVWWEEEGNADYGGIVNPVGNMLHHG